MKITVEREGRDEIFLPEKESLKTWIKSKKFKHIHNFLPNGSMFLGADHAVKSVLENIEEADRLGILIGAAQSNNMGHALAVIKDEKLLMFDIGKLSEDDLEII